MEAAQRWGLDLIDHIQSFGHPLVTSLFIAVTALGSGAAHLLLIPWFVWCVSYETGVGVLVAYSFSSLLNGQLKQLFHQPRPFHLDPSLQKIYTSGYGFPSGHAQNATVVWGALALLERRRSTTILAVVVVFSIGLSRVFLGVHFPFDVLAGWLTGGLLLGLLAIAKPWLERLFRSLRLTALLTLTVLAILLIAPSDDTAVLAGLLLGATIVQRCPRPQFAHGTWRQCVVRYIIGIGPAAGSILLRRAFPSTLLIPATVFSYLLYSVWVLHLAPALFVRLGLVRMGEMRTDLPFAVQ